jgi:hypothetical protein
MVSGLAIVGKRLVEIKRSRHSIKISGQRIDFRCPLIFNSLCLNRVAAAARKVLQFTGYGPGPSYFSTL